MINVRKEEDRMKEAIHYVENIIRNLTMEINACDYEEDPHGNTVYCEHAYYAEKRELENERRKWEIMLTLLTMETPFTASEW